MADSPRILPPQPPPVPDSRSTEMSTIIALPHHHRIGESPDFPQTAPHSKSRTPPRSAAWSRAATAMRWFPSIVGQLPPRAGHSQSATPHKQILATPPQFASYRLSRTSRRRQKHRRQVVRLHCPQIFIWLFTTGESVAKHAIHARMPVPPCRELLHPPSARSDSNTKTQSAPSTAHAAARICRQRQHLRQACSLLQGRRSLAR